MLLHNLTEEYMNRFVKIAAIPLLAAVLSGCSGKLPFTGKSPDFSVNKTFCAEIKSGKLEASANVTRADGEWEFAFTAPKTLCGVVVKFGEKGVSANLGSLSLSVADNADYALYPEIIAETIDALGKIPAEKISSAEGVLTAETDFEGSRTTVSADERTGKLISLKCPSYKLSVNFSDAQKPDAPQSSSSAQSSSTEYLQ